MKYLKLVVASMAAVVMGLAVSSASAAQFDFYKLKSPTGAGDFLPTDGIACTGGDLCSSNVDGSIFNGDLTFAIGSLTATATGKYNGSDAAVVQDHENSWDAIRGDGAGLGVYHEKNNSDDNITLGEVLTVKFNQQVTLTAIGLAYEGHRPTGWTAGATFLFNGSSTLLQGTIGSLSLFGDTFTFAFNPATGSGGGDQFYLSSMTVTPVPEPEIYAMLAAGLGLMGLVARRRKQHADKVI